MGNNFLTNEYTEIIQKLIREIVNDPSTYMGSKYLPSVALPVETIRTEVIEASGGVTNEHLQGNNPLYVQSFGTRTQEFKPCSYREAIHYDESRILYLRKLGDNGRNVRGIQQYIDIDMDRLNRRLEARIEKLRWDSIFNGGFTWMGKTVSFGVPGGNQVVPVGQVWSSGGGVANNGAVPLKDLRYWLLGGTSGFRKYKITKIISNPNTARWFLDNTNTLSYLTSYGANPALTSYDLNKTLQLLSPGLPPWEIYNGWYQTESVVSGKLTVSDAVYFIPDGYLFFEASLPGGDKVGEFVQGIHLSAGSVDAPGYGKFLVVDDNTAPGTKGGPGNPFIDFVAGVNGGPKMDRPFDLLTAKVI